MTYPHSGALDAATIPGPSESTSETLPQHARETWTERLEGALPLYFVGGVCIAIAVILYLEGAVTDLGGAAHLQPWILFVALGITGLSGATVALLAEEPLAEEVPEVPPEEAPPAPAAAPDWDESKIPPEEKPFRVAPRLLDEDELMSGPIAAPSPPDAFLRQLDDLEVSLRRKPRPPPKDTDAA